MRKKFTGMMITLKKRMICTSHDDTHEYQYLMYGHYDGADIACTNQWYQLRPKGVANRGGNIDVGDSFWDKYTLKLYFPEWERCEKLEKEGFAYNIWEELGTYEKHTKECDKLLEQFPFLSIAMINLSKMCVLLEDDLISKMQTVITEAAELAAVDLKQIHCAIMPSIGYADFVLLFLSNNLKNVITVLDNLRSTVVCNGKKEYAMLSNSYAISGFSRVGLKNLHNLKGLEDIKLSIRINLRDGISASQFKKEFDKELSPILKDYNGKKGLIDLYQVFGNSDCLILSDVPFDFFIPLYYDNRLLNPAHPLFDSYIQHTRSSIRIKTELTEETMKAPLFDSESKKIYELHQRKCQDLVKCLRKFANDWELPIRPINGLQTVMKAYLSLVQFSHCFDTEKIVGNAFDAVADNVDRTLEIIDENPDNCYEYVDQMIRSLNIFREKVEDYLADLRRSDRLFIEGQPLSHPSVGSATKLLFFYNQYINDMAEKLLETEENTQGKRFSFLVTSGGCDVTTACDLFSYMNPLEEIKHSLVIIKIPEMSLYDFRGTMFRLLHECLHFCGERKRELRLEKFSGSLSSNSAQVISNHLKSSIENHLDGINNLLKKYYPEEERNQIQERIKQIIQEETETLQKSIEKNLFSKLIKKLPKENYLLYGRNIYFTVSEILKEIIWFRSKTDAGDSFLHFVYREFMSCQKRTADLLILCLKEYSVYFSIANELKESSVQKLKMEKEGLLDREEEELIRDSFTDYTESAVFEENIFYTEEDEHISVDDVIFEFQDLFKECFADCLAAKILSLPIEDFLLCFLYETWDYRKAFRDPFRIAVELKVLYGVSEKLTPQMRQEITDKMAHWKKCGFQYQRNEGYAEEACDWVDSLLETYNQTGGYSYAGMNYVEEYLKEILDCYHDFSLKLPVYFTEVNKWSNMNSTEELYQLLEKVISTWKNIAE